MKTFFTVDSFGVRWLDTALDLAEPKPIVGPLVFEIESGVKPPHSKIIREMLSLPH